MTRRIVFDSGLFRRTRLEYGLTQEAAAEELGLPIRTLRRLDNGEVNRRPGGFFADSPRALALLERLARDWGLQRSALLREEDAAPPTPDPGDGPGVDAAGLLAQAMDVARARGTTWLGVEHLAEALVLGPIPAAADVARLRDALPPPGDPSWSIRTRGFRHRHLVDPLPTPRLRDALGALPAGFDVAALIRSLDLAAHPGLAAMEAPVGGTFDTWAEGAGWAGTATPAPAMGLLEVLGGPEDGRVFTAQPGDTVGRADGAELPSIALYADTASVDQRVHRRALRWEGPGALTLLHRTVVLTLGLTVELTGHQPVTAGTVLRLSHGTALRLR